ncbi:MAG: hypothetical protein REI78_04155 [Pedobacter sp.]|nr:hypothetical protein [Pedobacter sp.]
MNSQSVVPQPNLLVNADFMSHDPQLRPLDWVMGKGLQTATISSEEKHSMRKDDQSLKFADTSLQLATLVRSKKVIAAPGTRYLAKAWVKTRSGKAGYFMLEFWDQNNAIIASHTATVATAADWQEIKLDKIAPDHCTHVTVSISTKQAEIGVSYWDDIFLAYESLEQPVLQPGVRELFMDDQLIEEMTDVQRIVHPGVKSKVLIHPTEPWEATSSYIYGTVLHNEPAGTGYRMWYTSYIKEHYYLCYATSRDGLKWEKPNLGIFDFGGHKNNNICKEGGGTVVYDPLDTDPSKRYKLMTFDGSKERFGYNVFFSPDGLHWTSGHPKPVLPYGDVSNVAYDREKRLFIATTKQRMLVANTSVTSGKNDRMAFLSVSKDFINWTAPGAPQSQFVLAIEGDEKDDLLVRSKGGIESNVYGMPVYPYQGMYIGFPWMFDINTYGTGEFAVTGDGKIQPQVAVSRDLKHWSRPVRDPVIPVGQAGSWDDGTLYTSSTMQVDDREMSVYYGAMNLPHGGSTASHTQYARIAKATWRRDGLISLHNAGDDEGTVTTKALMFNGNELKVNTKLIKGGYLRAALLDDKDQVIPGFSAKDAKLVEKDQLSATIKWNTDATLVALAGKLIKIRFYLKGGDLYSYWFE